MNRYKSYSSKDTTEVRQELKTVAGRITAGKIDPITGLRDLAYLWRFADYREQHTIREFLTDFNFATEQFPKGSSCQHYRKDYLADLQKQEQRFIQQNWPKILEIMATIMQLPE
jgi:hypothetical protein